MNSASKSFLESLLTTPGVSGYEESVQQVVRDYVADVADDVRTDLHGNFIATGNPGSGLRLMFDGHCDQLGMVVSHVDDSGFLYFQTVGGWDPQQLVGQRVTIWTDGGEVPGVISRKAIHLLTDDEKKKVVEVKDMWIDIGAESEDDARSAVAIGDPVTVQLGFQEMRNGIANAPAMDNRTGVWVVFEAFRRAMEKGVACTLVAASTVQEEIGLRGARTAAYGIDPHVAIAVDVTHATDCPSVDKRQRGAIDLGKGPVILRGPNINPRVRARLHDVAVDQEIPRQVAALGRAAPNDSNALQITRAGVATGLVQIPNRYMHSAVETVSLSDLNHAADLLAGFAVSLAEDTDFTP
ncbi:MAG: M42 family metallopeptidase [Longimicrobiales bacterium]|nr:M42 family metallopeptidase [Longimicrobiales bacterium]